MPARVRCGPGRSSGAGGSAQVHTRLLSGAPSRTFDPGHLEHEHAADPGHHQVSPGNPGEEQKRRHFLEALSFCLPDPERGRVLRSQDGPRCLLPGALSSL